MSNTIRVDVVQLKRGTKANLERVLRGVLRPRDGEPIFEIDTGKLKFGDGVNDYIDLEYFKTGDVEVEDALDGQILIYNAERDRWEPKALADNKSIEYRQDGLQIAGFDLSHQGAIPVSGGSEQGIVWQQAITDETLDAKVREAQSAAYASEQSAGAAALAQGAAETAQAQTEQIRDLTLATYNKKF